jgi:hypothetical protein
MLLIFTTHFDPCLLTTAFAYLYVADSTNNGHRCIFLQPLEIFYELAVADVAARD